MKLIQSIQRAFEIIECFNEDNKELRLNEISKILNLNINTTRGIVNTLVYFSYLEHDQEKNVYKLGYIFLPKSRLLKNGIDDILIDNIERFLKRISNKYNVNARFHKISDNNIIKILSEEPDASRYFLYIKDSKDLPLNATSSGKLILKYSNREFLENYLNNIPKDKICENTITTKSKMIEELEKIENVGYSTEIDEVAIGISSIAVPVVKYGRLIATLSATAPTKTIKENSNKIANDFINFIENNIKIKTI
ncbi:MULTISPECIES: IclR family transcriptional regulator [Peptoniphilus]|uniref:IclR family transcriptional regulator n=1 Tax=Peptoniphilus TaxID=162289 RepID=UPI000785383C|nr:MULTISPECIES: IclR family transcriptional regulator C-terminal domain-containing protein [Peptoniphilus]KXB68337.1 IclR helix-turn-helix protein [Peptoniphilus sp. DNF00840]